MILYCGIVNHVHLYSSLSIHLENERGEVGRVNLYIENTCSIGPLLSERRVVEITKGFTVSRLD